jgi:hypothetical protein
MKLIGIPDNEIMEVVGIPGWPNSGEEGTRT